MEESGIRGCLGKVVMDVNADQPAFRNRMHQGLVEGSEPLENAKKCGNSMMALRMGE